VGVDIGCGMIACKTTLTAEDLPDDLGQLRSAIERAVPHGRAPGSRDPGAWQKAPGSVNTAWAQLEPEFAELCRVHPFEGRPKAGLSFDGIEANVSHLQPAPVPGSIEPRQQVSGRIAPSGSLFGPSPVQGRSERAVSVPDPLVRPLVAQERHKLAAVDTAKRRLLTIGFPCAKTSCSARSRCSCAWLTGYRGSRWPFCESFMR
jgi:hypothetical protein